jgi:aminopeptidase-like protein
MSEMSDDPGIEMHALARELFPLCRSITGNGVRQTLGIFERYLPLSLYEVPSGSKVFDWVVPPEWIMRDAYIANASGTRIVDFKKNNLHVLGYSAPIDQAITRKELDEHLHSLPDQPDVIPYRTSYYKERWGFCLTQRQRDSLPDGNYRVLIDSEHKTNGSLTLGECIIPGQTDNEIFLSTYVCHPSLANDNLSGPVLAVFLARWLREKPRKYTYRIVFVPETIGALAYLSLKLKELKERTVAGFNLTCVGDERVFSFMPSRSGDTIADRIALRVLRRHHPDFIRYSFLARASDERQYCAPGVDLPMVSVMRSKYGTFPEYHTSLDDLDFVTARGLYGSYEILKECIEGLEQGEIFKTTVLGEPQLGKRGLYPDLGTPATPGRVRDMMNFLAYVDGTRSLEDLAEIIEAPLEQVRNLANSFLKEGLIERVF